jgi:uncharacterized protein (UPF0332 family)
MRELTPWENCLREHVKKVQPDRERIASILKMCQVRQRVTEEIMLDDQTASVIAADYYEVIKELLTALLLKHGLKSDNHECLMSFFKNKYPAYDYEINVIYQLRDVRNRVSYEGVFVQKSYIEMNELEFKHIIQLLEKLIGDKP